MAGRWIAERAKMDEKRVPVVVALIVPVMQAILIARTIPAYSG